MCFVTDERKYSEDLRVSSFSLTRAMPRRAIPRRASMVALTRP